MPEITPLDPNLTIGVIQAKTQPASQILRNQAPVEGAPPPAEKQDDVVKEAVKAAVEEPQNSSHIAGLIRKERQLLKRARELSEKERLINEVGSTYKPWQEAAELAKTNKLEALKRLGIGYDELTQQLLNDGNVPPSKQAEITAAEIVKREIEAFKKEQAEQRATETQRQYQQAMRQIHAEADHLINSTDKYPLVKEAEASQDVARFIEQEFHRTGRVLSVEEAADRWESNIADGLVALAKHEKVRAKLNELSEQPVPKLPEPVQQKSTTLTNRAVQGNSPAKALSESERRQRAIDAFHNRLLS